VADLGLCEPRTYPSAWERASKGYPERPHNLVGSLKGQKRVWWGRWRVWKEIWVVESAVRAWKRTEIVWRWVFPTYKDNCERNRCLASSSSISAGFWKASQRYDSTNLHQSSSDLHNSFNVLIEANSRLLCWTLLAGSAWLLDHRWSVSVLWASGTTSFRVQSLEGSNGGRSLAAASHTDKRKSTENKTWAQPVWTSQRGWPASRVAECSVSHAFSHQTVPLQKVLSW
jgi:hypothetical protein